MNVSSQSLFVFCCGNVSQMSVACNPVTKQLPSSLTIVFATYLCVLVCFWIGDFLTCCFTGGEENQKEIVTEMVPCWAVSNWSIDQACEGSTGPEILSCPSLLSVSGKTFTCNKTHYSCLLTRCLQIVWSLKSTSTNFSHVLGPALCARKWLSMTKISQVETLSTSLSLFYYERSKTKIIGLHLKIVFYLSEVKKQGCCV